MTGPAGGSVRAVAATPPLTIGPVVEATGIEAGTTRQAGSAAGGTVLHGSVEAALGARRVLREGSPRPDRQPPTWSSAATSGLRGHDCQLVRNRAGTGIPDALLTTASRRSP